MEVAMPSFRRVLHMGLAVRDRQISAEWYERVLGFQFVKEFEVGIPRILLLHPDSGFLVGLYNHPEASADVFSPLRTGLDHFALDVGDQDQLDAWARHLDARGIQHSPVRELGHSSFISLQDPDGIQIEIWLTITPHVSPPPVAENNRSRRRLSGLMANYSSPVGDRERSSTVWPGWTHASATARDLTHGPVRCLDAPARR
jgi:glyoxylase I family protein